MYKAIKLFQQKHGDLAEWELLEYIKANSILRENIQTPNPELLKNALLMLSNLAEKSQNYEMKKGIYKYLISYYLEKNENLKTLQLAKSYYSGTRESFDFEESSIPALVILNSLAKLSQVEKIQELAQEKIMKKILPLQTIIAYQTYSYLKLNNVDEVISLYEKNKSAMTKPFDPVILYNAAEAYFRKGKFKEAMSLYQEFIKDYSHEFTASHAQLRIGLCSDLLDENYDETLELYKKAIDNSIDSTVSYEARIRYVAFRSVRKYNLDERDKEVRIFLETDKNEIINRDKNITKLLQQTRLRTLIVDGKYKDALLYLSLIPMISMAKIEARIFDGDGAEIVYGIIADYFKNAEYSDAIKTWQTYKDRYVDKVALDPFINFIVGSSYVKLGLYKGFDDLYASFEKLKETPNRTYPLWVPRSESQKANDLLSEMVIVKDIQLKSWDVAQKNLILLSKQMPEYNKINYYNGLIGFNQKNYKQAISDFETYFSHNGQRVIYDSNEVAEMIKAYTDSIYELKDQDKFLKVSEAILNDTKTFGTDNAYVYSVRERIAYLALEIMLAKKGGQNFMIFENKISYFLKNYPKSQYQSRVNYILGQLLINNQKVKEGKEVLKNLLIDKSTSDYIKELAKSELSLLSLKERTI